MESPSQIDSNPETPHRSLAKPRHMHSMSQLSTRYPKPSLYNLVLTHLPLLLAMNIITQKIWIPSSRIWFRIRSLESRKKIERRTVFTLIRIMISP